jgi:hypothetical protein
MRGLPNAAPAGLTAVFHDEGAGPDTAVNWFVADFGVTVYYRGEK